MGRLERRIESLESTVGHAFAPVFILEFIEPGRGVVAIHNWETGSLIERCAGESQLQFLARAQQVELDPQGRP